MGEISKAVRRCEYVHLPNVDGSTTTVLEVVYIDPSEPDVMILDRTIYPTRSLSFIPIDVHLVDVGKTDE